MNLINLKILIVLSGFRFNDFWDSLVSTGTDVLEKMQYVAPIGAAIALAGCGFMFIMGKRGAEAAKPWMMNVLIGLVVIFGALSIATWASSTTQF